MTGRIDFHSIRRAQIERSLRDRAMRFANRYDKTRPTVLLVPGSTGSQLDRSALPYQELAGSRSPRFDRVWLDLGAFISDIRHLEITENGEDADGHLIIPSGPFNFFFSPYDEMAKFFRERGFNFAVFSYDWRRSPEEAAELLELFLELLAAQVMERLGPHSDPRPRMTLACHSLGGLVALLLLQRLSDRFPDNPDAVADWLQCVVTVGTPFYGTGSALQRYYVGMPFLNECYGADVVARVIGSFPGAPVVHFLDSASYREYVDAFAERGEEPELVRYPSRDAADPDGSELDPYAAPTFSRYPPWKQRAHLGTALASRRRMHRRLPDSFLSRLFHIRVSGSETCCEIRWPCIDASNHRAGGPSPFKIQCGRGDGIVPHWSARFCYTPSTQVWDIAATAGHGFLMEDRLVLAGIEHITNGRMLPADELKLKARNRQRAAASPEYVRGLVADVLEGRIQTNDPVLRHRSVWRTFFTDVILG